MAININDWRTKLMSNNSIKVNKSDFVDLIESVRTSYKRLPKEIIPPRYVDKLDSDIKEFSKIYLENALGESIDIQMNDDIVNITRKWIHSN